MDDYEFDANSDRLTYLLDCSRLNLVRARAEYLAMGETGHCSPGQMAAARDRWQTLNARVVRLRGLVDELRVAQPLPATPGPLAL